MSRLLLKYHTDYRWRGMAFPPISSDSIISFKSDHELVRDSLFQLFNTMPGERVMYPTYGSQMRRLLFEPNDEELEGELAFWARKATQLWEPRVQIVDVTVDQNSYNKNNNIIGVFTEYALVGKTTKYNAIIAVALGS